MCFSHACLSHSRQRQSIDRAPQAQCQPPGPNLVQLSSGDGKPLHMRCSASELSLCIHRLTLCIHSVISCCPCALEVTQGRVVFTSACPDCGGLHGGMCRSFMVVASATSYRLLVCLSQLFHKCALLYWHACGYRPFYLCCLLNGRSRKG